MAELILDRVGKDFGSGRPAVDGLSMKIDKGSFVALLGPSGCGKTTVLRMIAGFEEVTTGSIRLGARLLADETKLVPPERRNMAMVFQSYALWPHMTVAGNVGYPLKVRGVTGADYRDKVRDALETVRLTAHADRRPADLSGGQRQRVALARCLVTSPDVVLLDEPLANLDRHLRQEMEESFRAFHRRSGATMIYVTHDQAEAMALASTVAVMSEGCLLQMASPADIYARPEGRIVGGLIGRGTILTGRLPPGLPRQPDWQHLRPLLSHGNEAEAGIAVDILVRPEDVQRDDYGLHCLVTNSLFEGERHLLSLLAPNGQRLLAYSREPVADGEKIAMRIASAWRL